MTQSSAGVGSQVESAVRLHEFWNAERPRIDAVLRTLLTSSSDASPRLYDAMRHAVLAGGKRLRPICCLSACKSLAGASEKTYAVAAALEMLHTYSLIHDDLPCMDDDDQRRGRPTVHIAFDEATAVLAGDALQALAFEVIAINGGSRIVSLIARAIGPQGMAGGQMADLEAEGKEPTEELASLIHRQKTGELIAASVIAGAMMAEASNEDLHRLERFAHSIGLAFQIVDDVLDLTQDSPALGKPTGSDLKHGKVTFPAAIGLEQSKERAARLVVAAKTSMSGYTGDPTLLLAIADFVVSRDR